ncbi:peptidoglycan-binding protein [Sulfuricaulis limicola]|uniref:Peptidoglycan-binding protein n=1 Tax=Sulfuricaulis limicola TaxID=1620215 RepID=A0A1B4XHJ7_9GAMM|nr:ExeA family protein [Sulfuricaulis limicola]BAV34278.1 peptidoglycan-binding protein [Sulfuricaulis limicola]
MYLQYFGLHENPFSIPPDPHYLYLSRGHQEALAHLQYGLAEAGGFVQLTGEVGTGKTLLVRTLVERLPEGVDVALILYPVLTVAEFIAAICDELRVPHPGEQASLKQLIDALNAHLLQTHARGRRTVLIIDEAQNLSREVLEQVRLLTNLETTKQKLLQIILIGQPELAQMLAQQDLRQLAQRITARFHLVALTRKENFEYILHRCRVAGAKAILFDRKAMEQVYAASGGIPRLINVICDRALLGAYTHGRQVVDMSIVKRAAREIGQGAMPKRRFASRAPAIASALVIVLVVAAWQWWPDWTRMIVSGKNSTEAVSAEAASASPKAVSAAGAIPVATATDANAATKLVEPVSKLEASLGSAEAKTDTESAMKELFGRWGLDYSALAGATACERALNAGLHCVYQTGTWNNLREHNRPAVIELQDTSGHKHHVLVTALTADSVSLAMGGSPQEFDVQEAGRLWFGKYLLLWKPPAPGQEILRLGDRGETILWLRDALARYRGEPLVTGASDLFDKELQAQLMQFQNRHRLAADGVAGSSTLAKLQGYFPGPSPTLVADTVATEAR